VDHQVDVATVLDAQQSADITSPQTTISIAGTPSSDGWYVGQITATISAEDNPGGTGVTRIDYSFDGGQTILEYTAPFMIDASVYRQILARSIDLAGNRSWKLVAPCYPLASTHTSSGGDPVASPANSIGCASGKYMAGESITLTASPSSGRKISSWTGTDNDASTSYTNTFTMPANEHTVSVNYTQPEASFTPNLIYGGIAFAGILMVGLFGLVAVVAWRHKPSPKRPTPVNRTAVATAPPVNKPSVPSVSTIEKQVNAAIELSKSGKYQEAYAILREVVKVEPNNAQAWLYLGVDLVNLKDFVNAERCLQRAKKLGHPKADQALEWLKKKRA
jgi:hypothetical protein